MLRAGFCRVLLLRAPRRRFAAAEGSEPLPSTAAAGAAAEREPPPRMVTESEEVDLLPPAAGERPHKVARRSSGRSAALRQPPTVRPGAARPGLGSAHPSPPAGSAERAVFSFPSAFQVFPLLSSPFHSLTAMEKEKKKKKGEPIKAAALGGALPPPQFSEPPPGPAQLRAAPQGYGKRGSLRAQESAASPRFTPSHPQDPPGKVGLSRGWGRRGGRAGCCEVFAPLQAGCGAPLRSGWGRAQRGCPTAAGRFRNTALVFPPHHAHAAVTRGPGSGRCWLRIAAGRDSPGDIRSPCDRDAAWIKM